MLAWRARRWSGRPLSEADPGPGPPGSGPAAGRLERAVSLLPRAAPPPQPSPPVGAGRGAGSTLDPGSGAWRRLRLPESNPAPSPASPSPGRRGLSTVGAALTRESARGGGWAGDCDRGGPGCAGEQRQICHCVDDSGKLQYLESRYLELGVKRSLPGALQRKTP